MGVIDVRDEFTRQSGKSCSLVTMDYLNSGSQQQFTFAVNGVPNPVVVVWDGMTDNVAIAKQAIAQLP